MCEIKLSLPQGSTSVFAQAGEVGQPGKSLAQQPAEQGQSNRSAPVDPRASQVAMGPRAMFKSDRLGATARLDAFNGQVDRVELTVGSAMIRSGRHLEAAAYLTRISGTNASGSVAGAMDVLSARLAYGTDNPDGSKGSTVGVMATAVAVEGTHNWPSGNSLTLGASVSVGAEGSLGFRDADGDGHPELCLRLSVGPATVGACLEDPFTTEAQR